MCLGFFQIKSPNFPPSPITEQDSDCVSVKLALPQATKKTMSATAQLALGQRIYLSSENLSVLGTHGNDEKAV